MKLALLLLSLYPLRTASGRLAIAFWICFGAAALSGVSPIQAQYARGISLAGPEFAEESLPGKPGTHYTFNSEESFAYFSSLRLNLIRVPFRWERLQPLLFGPLDEDYLAGVEQNVEWARAHGAQVVLDLHNYGRYLLSDGSSLQTHIVSSSSGGETKVPTKALEDLWVRLSERFRDDNAVYAYALMNEPHDMGDADWKQISQDVVDAIRDTGDKKLLMVAGDLWASAARWPEINGPDSWIVDPDDNFAYEAHLYFDHDNSGKYELSFEEELARNPQLLEVGVQRLAPFTEWCRRNGVRGYLGEYGVPSDDPRWAETLDRFLKALDEAGMDGTYWAAGEWWGDYRLSVQPEESGAERPQLAVLMRHLGMEHATLVSAASYVGDAAAPGALLSAFGMDLTEEFLAASEQPLPKELGGLSVEIEDVLGRTEAAELIFVSPHQVNFIVPANLPLGRATVTVRRGGAVARAGVTLHRLAPALFSANSDGVGAPAALLTRITTDGASSFEAVAMYEKTSARFSPQPLAPAAAGERVFLSLFGSGFRAGSRSEAFVQIGDLSLPALYIGPQPEYPGLDQVDVELPASLAGSGAQSVQLIVERRHSNTLTLRFE